jgi:hypothetical protein
VSSLQCAGKSRLDSLFLKPENADEVLVLTPETVSVRTEGKNQWNDIKEIDEFVERLKRNEVTYVYQNHAIPEGQDGEPAP